jgi:Fe-S cluster biogenesis protein NfuA
VLKPLVFEAIMEQFSSNKPLFNDEPQPEDTRILETDSETVALIKEILDARVRPFVQEDGGDIKFIDFEEPEGRVLLEMRGSCTGCPSSAVTLKNGIEKLLTYYVPEVKVVDSVDNR